MTVKCGVFLFAYGFLDAQKTTKKENKLIAEVIFRYGDCRGDEKMSYTEAGHCSKCGAPYYVPTFWMSVLPPTPMPSCQCWNTGKVTTAPSTSVSGNDVKIVFTEQKNKKATDN